MRLSGRTEDRRRGSGTTRLDRPGDANLPPLRPNHVRCPICHNGAGLSAENHLWSHRTPDGYPCHNRMPDLTPVRPIVDAAIATEQPVDAGTAPRTGHCVDCGKWLPGERTLCGACGVRRNNP